MKMKKTLSLLLAMTMVLLLLAGCGKSSSHAAVQTASNSYAYAEDSYAYEWEAEEAPAPMAGSGSTADTLPQNRKWVITMDISAETEDLDAALEGISGQITALGGYIESQYIRNGSTGSSSRRYADMSVRIPVGNLDSFLQDIQSATNVVSSSRNVQDITLSYTDAESRVTALRTEEARLLELMAQAENMSDLLIIEERLTEVRYMLESYTSQLRRYDNQVDYATISLGISEVKQYTPPAERGFWQRIGDGFVRSCQDLVETLADILSWIIVNLPWLVFLALIVLLIVFIWRRIAKRSAAKRAARYQKQMAQYQQYQAAQAAKPEEKNDNP